MPGHVFFLVAILFWAAILSSCAWEPSLLSHTTGGPKAHQEPAALSGGCEATIVFYDHDEQGGRVQVSKYIISTSVSMYPRTVVHVFCRCGSLDRPKVG